MGDSFAQGVHVRWERYTIHRTPDSDPGQPGGVPEEHCDMNVPQNAKTRFSDRVADYERARPSYPDALVELLETEAELTPAAVLADIGSGTGLSAEPFLRSGHTVYCVEPNDAMRSAAERRLGGFAGFRSVAGTAESTTLEGGSVDHVMAGQAFHWFDLAAARREFVRIMRPGGWLVVFWNTRLVDATPFLREYEALLVRFGTDYLAVRARTESLAAGTEPGGALYGFVGGAVTRRVLRNEQAFDFAGLARRLRSASYVPAAGSAAYPAMMAELEEIFARHEVDGRVSILYDLEVFFARLRPAGG